MRRNLRQRIIAGVLALLGQAGLIAWITQSRPNNVEHEADSPYLILIQPLQQPDVAPVRPRIRGNNPTTRPVLAPNSGSVDPIEPAETNRAITTSTEPEPPINWYRDLDKVAHSPAEKFTERELHGELLDSKPDILKLPADTGDELAAVTATRLDNGDLVTRHRITKDLTVICVHAQIPVTQHFDIGVRQRPPNCHRISESTRGPLFEDIKPDYLRKPLPVPRPPQAGKTR